MANIREMLFLLKPRFAEAPPLPAPPEDPVLDRLDLDLVGLSDADAMWYYERRHWRGRD